MHKRKKIIGVIPARGGSKGLIEKNMRPLLEKPLIAWTIEHALGSKYLDKVVVSTDSNEIADISRKYGADVPFMRPRELATDEATSIDVLMHALDYYRSQGVDFDYLALLEPTSPLREVEDVNRCVEILCENAVAKSIVSVAKLEGCHPEFNVVIDKNTACIRRMNGSSEFSVLRRQELNDVFFFEGTMYLSEVEILKARRSFYHELTLPYIVPRWKSLEIDEYQDLVCAEALLRARADGLLP